MGKYKFEKMKTFALAMTMAVASAWTDTYTFSVVDLEQFTIGLLKGAIEAEVPDFMTCLKDAETLASDVETAYHDFAKESFSGVKSGIEEIGTIVHSISGDIKDCKAGISGFESLIQMAKNFENPWSFAYHVGKDLLVNGVKIYHEVDDAIADYEVSDYNGFGENIGKALAQVLIGEEHESLGSEPCNKPVGDVVWEDTTCWMRETCGTGCEEGECKWNYPVGGSPDDATCACKICTPTEIFLQ